MSENQDEPAKPEVPPPSLHKGPPEPPPPSVISGAPSPPPPSLSKSPPPPSLAPGPPPPPTPVAEASPIKVRVKPDGEDGEDHEDGAAEPLVSLATRVGAAMIDFGIAMGLYIAAVIVLPGFMESAATLLAVAYIVLRDGLPFLNGQSVGKTAMKIKAVTRDGQSLSGNWQPAVVRNVVLLIPLFALIELIVLLTREDKPDQGVRLGDEWAKTMVVPVIPEGDSESTENDGRESVDPGEDEAS